MAAEARLVCPVCGPADPAHPGHAASERFCPRCGMPLVFAESEGGPEGPDGPSGPHQPLGELWQRARRVKPQYSEGDARAGGGGAQPGEADFIQNLLLEEGIPSMQRRARGFDVPDFLAAGPARSSSRPPASPRPATCCCRANCCPRGTPPCGAPPRGECWPALRWGSRCWRASSPCSPLRAAGTARCGVLSCSRAEARHAPCVLASLAQRPLRAATQGQAEGRPPRG